MERCGDRVRYRRPCLDIRLDSTVHDIKFIEVLIYFKAQRHRKQDTELTPLYTEGVKSSSASLLHVSITLPVCS